MHKAKVHLRYARDIVGSARWQRQPQQQSHVRYERLWSSEDTTYVKEYGRLVGEKPTTVRVPGKEHDRSASNAVIQSKYATE